MNIKLLTICIGKMAQQWQYEHKLDPCNNPLGGITSWRTLFDFSNPEFTTSGESCTMNCTTAKLSMHLQSYGRILDKRPGTCITDLSINLVACYATWKIGRFEFMIMLTDGKIDTVYERIYK
jgi:hypothetical protein